MSPTERAGDLVKHGKKYEDDMKVLVTGATGFLGSHLSRQLVKNGFEVSIFCRSALNTDILSDLKVKRITGDITDSEAVEKAVAGHDVVFHAAAHLAYWNRWKNLQNQINIEGTRNVVDACRKVGVKKLLHISSVAAIGIPENPDSPADENFRFNLENSRLNYHISKRRGEEFVLKGVEDGLDAVIVNPGSIWGRFGKQFRGVEFAQKVRQKRVVPYFTGGICVVHVEDVVDGILAAAKNGRSGERYILGGENLTLKKIAEQVAKEQRLERTFIPVPNTVTLAAATIMELIGLISHRRPSITFATHYCASRFHYYDSRKAKKELGYLPRDFKTILDECVSYIKSQNGEHK